MCINAWLSDFLASISKQSAHQIQYTIRVDGFEIGAISLPELTQGYRDIIRGKLAKEYDCPIHYIELSRKFREEYVWPASQAAQC